MSFYASKENYGWVHFVFRGSWQEEFFYSPLSNLCQEQLGAVWDGAWSSALLPFRLSLWLRPVEHGERLPGSKDSTVLSEIPGTEERTETRYIYLNSNLWTMHEMVHALNLFVISYKKVN